MYLVRPERWHLVEQAPDASTRRCSVCGSTRLGAARATALDGATRARYAVVRCAGCEYDLLDPLPAAA